MNMMVTEMYDALISAGAEEVKARAAAEGMALEYRKSDQQFSALREDNQKMRTEMTELRGHINTEFVAVRGELTLVKGMLGVLVAIAIAIAFRVFTI